MTNSAGKTPVKVSLVREDDLPRPAVHVPVNVHILPGVAIAAVGKLFVIDLVTGEAIPFEGAGVAEMTGFVGMTLAAFRSPLEMRSVVKAQAVVTHRLPYLRSATPGEKECQQNNRR